MAYPDGSNKFVKLPKSGELRMEVVQILKDVEKLDNFHKPESGEKQRKLWNIRMKVKVVEDGKKVDKIFERPINTSPKSLVGQILLLKEAVQSVKQKPLNGEVISIVRLSDQEYSASILDVAGEPDPAIMIEVEKFKREIVKKKTSKA